MDLSQLFARKLVLTRSDILASLGKEYSRNERSRKYLIRYHLREGHLLQVRRGCMWSCLQEATPKRRRSTHI